MNEKAKSSGPSWVDPDDAPEITYDWIVGADEYVGDTLVRRGRPTGSSKAATTIRFDNEVIEVLR